MTLRGTGGGQGMRRLMAVIAAAAVLALSACQAIGAGSGQHGQARHHIRHASAGHHHRAPHKGRTARLARVHDPRQVTGTLTGQCHARDGGRLPDPGCTPGAVDPAVTQANIASTICVAGYTESVRPPEAQTEEFKFRHAYPAYGIADGVRSELDHLVPLELGGANDAANLWPEAGQVPNPKDDVERALNRAVCDGRISLADAQRAIASNWETAESRLGL
jgi:hypothetical protein